MNKKASLYILVFAVCGLILFLLFYLFSPNDQKISTEKQNKNIQKKPNDWQDETYGPKVYDPYGTYIFYQLLREQKNKIRIVKRNSQYKYLDTVKNQKRLYVLVTKNFNTHYRRIEKIMNFVYRGNFAFISANNFPNELTNLFYSRFEHKRSYYKDIQINFYPHSLRTAKGYKLKFYFKRKNIYTYWSDFYDKKNNYEYNEYDDSTSTPDSTFKNYEFNKLNQNTVFLSIKYGKGMIFLHSIPYSFSNLIMRHELGVEHAEKVISLLPDVPVLYDTYLSSVNASDHGGGEKTNRSSPLQFILENRSLRWAYYLLLTMALIYLIFKGKRKQKIIPPKETFENTTVQFADTMSKLYLQYGQHKYLVFQQEKNLMNYIRGRYYFHTRNADDEFVNRLAVKSGIELDKLNELFKNFRKTKQTNHANSDDVIRIHNLVEYFYKNCK